MLGTLARQRAEALRYYISLSPVGLHLRLQ